MATTHQRRAPGELRDAIIAVLADAPEPMSVHDITDAVEARIGAVKGSSVRSYLNLNRGNGDRFERTGHGVYKLRR